MQAPIKSSAALHDVRYEIRGQLASRALELEKLGYEIISLNIGDPGIFGFRTPETMRFATRLDDQTFALDLLENHHVLIASTHAWNNTIDRCLTGSPTR